MVSQSLDPSQQMAGRSTAKNLRSHPCSNPRGTAMATTTSANPTTMESNQPWSPSRSPTHSLPPWTAVNSIADNSSGIYRNNLPFIKRQQPPAHGDTTRGQTENTKNKKISRFFLLETFFIAVIKMN